jgi:hypothetical protein
VLIGVLLVGIGLVSVLIFDGVWLVVAARRGADGVAIIAGGRPVDKNGSIFAHPRVSLRAFSQFATRGLPWQESVRSAVVRLAASSV